MADGPVWTAFDPDTIDDDALGWIWHSGEWHPVKVDPTRERLAIVFVAPGSDAELCDWQSADLYKGFPYIPAHKPSVTPHECDALEVHVSLPGGGSYALAYAEVDKADATLKHLSELLKPGSKANG